MFEMDLTACFNRIAPEYVFKIMKDKGIPTYLLDYLYYLNKAQPEVSELDPKDPELKILAKVDTPNMDMKVSEKGIEFVEREIRTKPERVKMGLSQG